MIRVGIDTTSLIKKEVSSKNAGYCAPAFVEEDKDRPFFEYIPISEDPRYLSSETKNYSNTPRRNKKKIGRYLADFLDTEERTLYDGQTRKTAELQLHYDPEFCTFTYGDYRGGRMPIDLEENLRADSPSYLFFYAGLSSYDRDLYEKEERTIDELDRPGEKPAYIIGYFKIDEMCEVKGKDCWPVGFENNAHFKRQAEPDYANLVVVRGDASDSMCLDRAIRLNCWNARIGKYVPTEIAGKKICLKPMRGMRIALSLNSRQTRDVLKIIHGDN
jgi:hypothetical protein